VFENRVLRRKFEPRRDEVTGGWRKLHFEEFHTLFSLPCIIRMIKSRRVRTEEKMPLGIQKWVDNIKMDLREIRWVDMDLAQDTDRWRALVMAVMSKSKSHYD
jgi:hypothetical protein